MKATAAYDFMFQLSVEEFTALRSQFVTSNAGRDGRRYAPYVATHDQAIAGILHAMRELMKLPETKKRSIGLCAKMRIASAVR